MGLYIKSLLLAFFNFSSLIHGQNLCPSSSCGSSNMKVQYPFRFEHEHEHKHKHEQSPSTSNCTYFNLTCNQTQSSTLVHLPHAGDFYVENINYAKQSIQLYDPANCLMRRLFNSSLQSSPFKAEYGNYTFYVCPLDSHISPIRCLSNATNITVAIREPLDDYRCSIVGSRMLPVDHDEIFLYLTWDSDGDCVDCHHESSRWGAKLIAKIVAVAMTMPGLIIMSLSCCSVFCFHLMKMIGGVNNGAAEAAPTAAATELPLGNTGLDESKIVACTEMVVVSGSDEGTRSKMCWICLENYSERERVSVIRKCGHCFHACCIQQWLGKNGSCPVCRTSLSDVV